jgi:hypothetical protein
MTLRRRRFERVACREAEIPAPGQAVWHVVLLFAALFLLRVWNGLSLELRTDDEVQIYLLGLKLVTTRQWPYFGPDVAHDTLTQLPGALQSLLVAVPLALSRAPEAPLILLNVLSFTGLVAFGLYLSRRFPIAPAWMTCAWLLTCPWTLKYSTHVYNPSYLLFPSCVFFVGFLELMPGFTGGLLPPRRAFFLLGAALGAVIQIHSSWPLLLPFVAVALSARMRARRLTASEVGALLLGLVLPLVLVVPTIAKYGFQSLFASLLANSRMTAVEHFVFVKVAARFLSFASYQPPYAFGPAGQDNATLLWRVPWLMPVFAFLLVVGLVQPVLMLAAMIDPRLLRLWEDPHRGFRALVIGTMLLIAVAFAFTTRPPTARNYYVLCPVAFLTGYLTFASLLTTVKARRWALTIMACSVVFHVGYGLARCWSDPWSPRRSAVARALQDSDYRVLAKRRAHSRY